MRRMKDDEGRMVGGRQRVGSNGKALGRAWQEKIRY